MHGGDRDRAHLRAPRVTRVHVLLDARRVTWLPSHHSDCATDGLECLHHHGRGTASLLPADAGEALRPPLDRLESVRLDHLDHVTWLN